MTHFCMPIIPAQVVEIPTMAEEMDSWLSLPFMPTHRCQPRLIVTPRDGSRAAAATRSAAQKC